MAWLVAAFFALVMIGFAAALAVIFASCTNRDH